MAFQLYLTGGDYKMYPLLYHSTSTVVSPYSLKCLGRMTLCKSCKVTEERNGDYTLTANISVNDSCAQIIKTQYFMKVKPNPFHEPQYFEIYDITYINYETIKIKAKHIKHNFYNNVVSTVGDFGDSIANTPLEFWENFIEEYILLENHFTFYSDISTTAEMKLGYSIPCTIGDLMSDNKESLLDTYGGEYEYNNFNVRLLKKRGKDSGYRLRWGQNISSCEQTITSKDIASHIVAVAKVFDELSGKSYYLTGNVFPLTSSSSKLQKLYLLDISDETSKNPDYWTINSKTGENIDLIIGQLNVRATAQRQIIAESNGKPKTNIKINIREELDNMKYIGLCDTVNVDANGEFLTAKIIKTEYDALLERWEKLELGTPKSRLSDYIIK